MCWKSLQDDLCVRKSTSGPQTKSYNVSRALFWAREGRYSNAVQSLTSTGVADKNDDCAFQELIERHPTSDPPSCSAPKSASLVVDESAVLMCLKGFPRVPVLVLLVYVLSIFLTQSVDILLHLLRTVFMLSLGL